MFHTEFISFNKKRVPKQNSNRLHTYFMQISCRIHAEFMQNSCISNAEFIINPRTRSGRAATAVDATSNCNNIRPFFNSKSSFFSDNSPLSLQSQWKPPKSSWHLCCKWNEKQWMKNEWNMKEQWKWKNNKWNSPYLDAREGMPIFTTAESVKSSF